MLYNGNVYTHTPVVLTRYDCSVLLYILCVLYRAEQATKAKLEKVAEIKRLNAHLVAIKKYVHMHTVTKLS